MVCLGWPQNQSTLHLTGVWGTIIWQQGARDAQGYQVKRIHCKLQVHLGNVLNLCWLVSCYLDSSCSHLEWELRLRKCLRKMRLYTSL